MKYEVETINRKGEKESYIATAYKPVANNYIKKLIYFHIKALTNFTIYDKIYRN